MLITHVVEITKAGVPSNKVVVGVASYGRSFAMADPGCDGQDCFYLGDKVTSMATKGPCTDTAGYISNAEIKAILSDATRVTNSYVDSHSNSNILVYDGNQWVGWMSDGIKGMRKTLYKGLNMGGVTDWADDLDDYHDSPPPPSSSWSELIVEVKAGKEPNMGDYTENGNWSSLDCSDPSMDYLDYTPAQRWAMMDGKDAWTDVINVWKTRWEPKGNVRFSEALAAMCGGNADANCETFLKTNNCDSTLQNSGCSKHPASSEIWNSVVLIHEACCTHLTANSARQSS